MRKQFCKRCHCKTKCKRICKIVYAELVRKGIQQTLHEADKDQYPIETGALLSTRSIRAKCEYELSDAQVDAWLNRAYGAYSDPKE